MKSNDSYTVSTGASYSGLQDYYEHLAAGGQFSNWTTNPKLLAQIPGVLQTILSHLARNYINNRPSGSVTTLINTLKSNYPKDVEGSTFIERYDRDMTIFDIGDIKSDTLTDKLINDLKVLKGEPLQNTDFPSLIAGPVIAYLKNGIGHKINSSVSEAFEILKNRLETKVEQLRQAAEQEAGNPGVLNNVTNKFATAESKLGGETSNIIANQRNNTSFVIFGFPPGKAFTPEYTQLLANAEAIAVFNRIKDFIIASVSGRPPEQYNQELVQSQNLVKNAAIYTAQQKASAGKDDLKPSGSSLPSGRDMAIAMQKTVASAKEGVLKVDIMRRKLEQELADKGIGYYYRPMFVEPKLELEKVVTNMKEPALPQRMQMKDAKSPGKLLNISNNNQPNPVMIQNLPVWRNKTKDKKYLDKIMINDKSLLKFKLNATFEPTGYLPKKKRVN